MPKLSLTNQNYKWIAQQIHPQCEPELVIGFAKTECKRDPFDPDGFPAILYERHVVYRNITPRSIAKQLASEFPSLIYSSGYGPGGYGSYASQRVKLSKTMNLLVSRGLTNEAALEGCSWGAFQELGENWANYGFSNVGDFVDTMKNGLYGQSVIFIRSIKSRGLVQPMLKKDFQTMALKYNGSGYRTFKYDEMIEENYEKAKAMNIDWDKIEAIPPAKATKALWLGDLMPKISVIGHEEPNIINEAHNNEEAMTPALEPSNEENQTSEVKIGSDGSIEAKTSTDGTNQKPEVVVVEKPEPKNFREKIKNKIMAVVGGNLTWAGLMAKLQEASVLGMPYWFWIAAIGIVLVGSLIWIIGEYFKHRTEENRDEKITDSLVVANSTPTNTVMLGDSDMLAQFEKLGAKIIRR